MNIAHVALLTTLPSTRIPATSSRNNDRVNFHWERCMENGTKVGQYGRLHEDGFSYRTSYYADNTGYHPKSTKVALTGEQKELVHEFTEGVFILPKVGVERR